MCVGYKKILTFTLQQIEAYIQLAIEPAHGSPFNAAEIHIPVENQLTSMSSLDRTTYLSRARRGSPLITAKLLQPHDPFLTPRRIKPLSMIYIRAKF